MAGALGAIDACRFFDRYRHQQPQATVTPLGGNSCLLRDPSGLTETRALVISGKDFGHTARYLAAPIDLDGARAYQMTTAVSCLLNIPVSFTKSIELTYQAASGHPDCDSATRLGRDIVATLRAQPEVQLLFATGEPDEAPIGACLNFLPTDGEDCQPARNIQLPQGTDAILRAATDPNVPCALFAHTVSTAFGPQFAPLTWHGHCVFVSPAHELTITVGADAQNVPGSNGVTDLSVNRATTTIGGKPAVTFSDVTGHTYEVHVSPYGDLNRPGALSVYLSSWRPRGDATGPDKVAVAPADANHAGQALTEVINTYFA